MTRNELIFFVGFILVCLSVLGAFLGLMYALLDDWFKTRAMRRLEEDLGMALKLRVLTWEKVQDLAALRDVPSRGIGIALERLRRDILVGQLPDLDQRLSAVDGYLSQHRTARPLEGLPAEFRVLLSDVGSSAPQCADKIQSLAGHVRTLIAHNDKVSRRQRFYGTGFPRSKHQDQELPGLTTCARQEPWKQHGSKREANRLPER